MKNPVDVIKKYFEYLVKEYDYHIVDERFAPETMGNAYVTYKSATIGIRIVVDRSQVLINIGDVLSNEREWFDFIDVVKYFSPAIDNPYVFIEKTRDNTTDDIIETQVSRLASILYNNCKPLLIGGTWMMEEIKKIGEKRVAEMFKKFRD